LYETREDFREHLRRPEHKQTFVTTWQRNYNEIADDLRQDEETKSELHQRLDVSECVAPPRRVCTR